MSEKELLLNTLLGLAMIVEARDPYTGGHLWRVSQFSKLLALQAGLSGREVALCEIGGFLHDLGKVGVPDAILGKPDRLTSTEYEIVKSHPLVGGKILASHPLSSLAVEAVMAHHERPDGAGYPYGLKGESIPLVARVVGIADAFDAMTSTRPYRKGMSTDKAKTLISEGLDRQFDKVLGTHFLSLSLASPLEHIVGHSEPGIPLLSCPSCTAPVVVRRAQDEGAYVYCRVCGGESKLHKMTNGMKLEMTGGKGSAYDLALDADQDLIGRMVAEVAPHVL
ncbi:MAG: HD-GYP domain-containing protein [Betaproteobacteria bacterium]|nr:HD-GYP domain-containing protein [Betaproteobacteria bacterium]